MKETKFKQTLVQTKEGSRHCEERSDVAIQSRFKMTEVGMIPSDWNYAVFGNLVFICRGGSPRPIDAYITSNPSGINWIKIGDVAEGDKYITSTKERIIPEGKKSSREVHSGDFILSNSMSFGRPYILKIDGCIHDGWLAIQNYQDTFDTNFLYYLLSSENVYAQYVSMAAGSSVQNLNKEKVAAVKLSFPSSKKEQQRIANALSDVDTLIENLEKLIAKKKNIKQGAMQQLLTGKKRLPGFAPAKPTYKQTELGKIPTDWEVKTLDELCTREDNKRIPIAEGKRKKGQVPYYGANGIQDYVEGFTHNGNYILIAEDGANSLTDYPIQFVSGKIWVNNHAHILKAKDIMDIHFAYYGFKTIDFESNIVGCGRAKLNASVLMGLKCIVPSKEEQTAIANVLSDMDAEISALETKLAKYRTLKTGMMQQLLTGKIRLIK